MIGPCKDRDSLGPVRTGRRSFVCLHACLYRNEWVVTTENDKGGNSESLEVFPWVIPSPDADLLPRSVVETESLGLRCDNRPFALRGSDETFRIPESVRGRVGLRERT